MLKNDGVHIASFDQRVEPSSSTPFRRFALIQSSPSAYLQSQDFFSLAEVAMKSLSRKSLSNVVLPNRQLLHSMHYVWLPLLLPTLGMDCCMSYDHGMLGRELFVTFAHCDAPYVRNWFLQDFCCRYLDIVKRYSTNLPGRLILSPAMATPRDIILSGFISCFVSTSLPRQLNKNFSKGIVTSCQPPFSAR